MDYLLLHAVVREAAARLMEQEVGRVSHLGRSRYLLRFANASRDNLLLSVRADLPRIHLMPRGRIVEVPPDRFAALLDREIGGAVLSGIETRPWDRIVEMRFRLPRREAGALERRLVVELLGRSANLILLDATGVILEASRDLKSRFRAPVPGELYRPPPGREAWADLPVGPEALRLIRERFGDPVAFLAKLSPLLADDLERASAGDPAAAEARVAVVLEALRDGTWSPVVYSRRPLEVMRDAIDPERDDLVVSPLPLLAPPFAKAAEGVASTRVEMSVVTRFASPSDAAAALGLAEGLRDLRDQRAHHAAIVRHEIERLQTLTGKLEAELERARGSESRRHAGEALLAGLTAARVEGSTAHVPDPYDPDGPPLAIPIDPARSLQENAQTQFERYKKGKRGVETIGTRLRAARSRLLAWQALAAPAEAVRTQEDLDRLRDAMAGLGLVHAQRPPRGAAPQRTEEPPARVRRYTSPEGLMILVGKSGEENDTLTFRVASPWDFWLHAAERPGAHVVVRNPQRLKTLPEKTLRAAAEIAAFHSGAREEAKVEVHYTQRKHVHKRRGMPRGQVLLRRFRTIQVTPRVPSPTVEEV